MASPPLLSLSTMLSILLFVNSVSSSLIVLPLSHSLSSSLSNTTAIHHLLKSSSLRSAARSHRGRRRHRQISLPLSPGSDYTLSLSLAPSRTISLYMDTGSDLVWFPCRPFECILCEGKRQSSDSASSLALSLPTSATPIPCSAPACSAAHSSHSPSDLCASARCPLESIELSECSPSSFPCPSFYYAYADGSFVANLYSHNVSIPLSSPHLHLRNFTFGCAHTALGEPTGVAGFGRGLLSLPAQLSRLSPQLPNRFSYCLVSHSFDPHRIRNPSPLILGRTPPTPTPTPTPTKTKNKRTTTPNADNSYYSHYSNNNDDEFVYTPMLDNPKHPYFYCVGLEAVTVGETRIAAPVSLRRVSREGNGGMVVDSGTTFTMLPSKLHQRVVAEFDRRVGRLLRRATPVEDRTGLRPCYYYGDGDGDAARHVPRVVLHFGGNASVALPRRNYFFGYVSGGEGRVGCLMVMDGGDDEAEEGGPAGTLGNYQQQGFEVVYDLEKGKVGFARKHCASLWDSLNGH